MVNALYFISCLVANIWVLHRCKVARFQSLMTRFIVLFDCVTYKIIEASGIEYFFDAQNEVDERL